MRFPARRRAMKSLTGLERTIRFQKAVRSADRAAAPGEAEAAMNATRRLMEAYQKIPLPSMKGRSMTEAASPTARRWQSSVLSICSRREGRPSRRRATSMRPRWQGAAGATDRSRGQGKGRMGRTLSVPERAPARLGFGGHFRHQGMRTVANQLFESFIRSCEISRRL
jgi:hypothetical protein